MRAATAILSLIAASAIAVAEDHFPSPEEQALSFAPYENALIDGVLAAHWLAAHKALLLTGVRSVSDQGGGAAAVRNEGFASATILTADGYLLTVRHSLQEPVLALRRAIGHPDLQSARVVWSGEAGGCDLALLKVGWTGCEACVWAPGAELAAATPVLSGGCYLAEDEHHQWFRDDRGAGALLLAPEAMAAAGASPAFSLIQARLLAHPGDSGGPVVTQAGQLVGVTMAHLLDPASGASTGSSLVIRPDLAFIERTIAGDRAAHPSAGVAAAAIATVVPDK